MNTERHHELARAVECGSTELAIFSMAYMLDDRLQELTTELRTLNASLAQIAEYTDFRGQVESSR